MAEEELRAELNRRMDALDNSFADLVKELRAGNGKAADRKVSEIESEFSAEELQGLRDQRNFETFRRNAERLGEELEREADELIAEEPDEEEPDEEEDEESEEEPEAEAKPKPKPKAKPRPRGGRHPKPEPEPEPEQDTGGILAWLTKD